MRRSNCTGWWDCLVYRSSRRPILTDKLLFRRPRAAWYQVKIAQIFQQLPQSFIQMFRLVSLYYDGLPAVRTVTALSFALSCAAVCNTLTSSGVNVSIIWRIPFTVFCFFQLILRLVSIANQYRTISGTMSRALSGAMRRCAAGEGQRDEDHGQGTRTICAIERKI